MQIISVWKMEKYEMIRTQANHSQWVIEITDLAKYSVLSSTIQNTL